MISVLFSLSYESGLFYYFPRKWFLLLVSSLLCDMARRNFPLPPMGGELRAEELQGGDAAGLHAATFDNNNIKNNYIHSTTSTTTTTTTATAAAAAAAAAATTTTTNNHNNNNQSVKLIFFC